MRPHDLSESADPDPGIPGPDLFTSSDCDPSGERTGGDDARAAGSVAGDGARLVISDK